VALRPCHRPGPAPALPPGTAARLFLALAAAPALPAADWAAAVRGALAAAQGGGGGGARDAVAAGAALLALSHGHVAQLGLSGLLEELAAPGR
jgi:hypothetical protein